MLNCSRMTHRVHTILSILAEDHAPAALRPSILLAIDWPTVAEEAPATGDDSGIACAASGLLSGIGGREVLPALTMAALPLLAARLATVAASLAATGDKAMATHAAALWGAAAALVGMPSGALSDAIAPLRAVLPSFSNDPAGITIHLATERITRAKQEAAALDALALKAADIVPGVIAVGPAEKATLVATALDRVRDLKTDHNKALADIHALRDILKVPEGGNLVDHASAFAERHSRMHAENTRLRAQVDRMIAAMREDAPAPVKPRPQPGDVVPWTEVEDGCLYYGGGQFRMAVGGQTGGMFGPDDQDIEDILSGKYSGTLAKDVATWYGIDKEAILVARDLGSDPEAWRKAMREWTANGDKPAAHAPGQSRGPG